MNNYDMFWKNGFLHVPDVFNSEEIDNLTKDLEWMMVDWAENSPGWSGAWRRELMDEETEKKSTLTAMHDLQFYSKFWFDAVSNEKIVSLISELIPSNKSLITFVEMLNSSISSQIFLMTMF